MHHRIKIAPAYFEAVKEGRKNFEIRFNDDRGYQAGDTVTLCEWDKSFTMRELEREITYVTNYKQKDGYVVFAMKKPAEKPNQGETPSEAITKLHRIKATLASVLLSRTTYIQPYHANAIRQFLDYPSDQELKAMVQAGRTT